MLGGTLVSSGVASSYSETRTLRAPERSALLVVDGPEVAEAWRRALSHAGFRVRVRYGGHDGLDALAHEPSDLVVLDLWSGGLDALAFLKIAKQLAPDSLGTVLARVDASATGIVSEMLQRDGAQVVLHGPLEDASVAEAVAALRLAPVVEDSEGVLAPGSRISDRFVVDSQLGRGATATVYRVTDVDLLDEVALKLLEPGVSVPEATERLRQELRLCRRINHPNVVRTFDYGTWDDRPFFTMELLEGRTLGELLESRNRDPLPLAVGIPLFVQACRGLEAAHRIGVMHRDIKPDNLFVLDGDRQLKLMDFGIAKNPEECGVASTEGLVLGTPAYVAPERLRENAPATPQSDLYSLGVAMFEAFTGQVPFDDPDLGRLLGRVVRELPPDPCELNPALSKGMGQLIRALMRKDPNRRPVSARDLERRLTALIP